MRDLEQGASRSALHLLSRLHLALWTLRALTTCNICNICIDCMLALELVGMCATFSGPLLVKCLMRDVEQGACRLPPCA